MFKIIMCEQLHDLIQCQSETSNNQTEKPAKYSQQAQSVIRCGFRLIYDIFKF